VQKDLSLRSTEQYYETDYKDRQLKADLDRQGRLRFCFPEGLYGKKILSIGCGPAKDIDFLLNNNEVHGIDISERALEIAASAGIIPHKLNLDSIPTLPFSEDYFDVIIATDILEHLFSPQATLVEINRVLKRDGFSILSVPNHLYLKMRLRILKGADLVLPFHKQSKQWDYFHIRFFTSKGFEELLSEAGFNIIERYYNNFIDIPRGLPRRLDLLIAKKYPDLFSMHFLLKASKK
jgi:2-polyprenyl-3-methyl-5-hydroxy-6-metoxy-1,4-benzoquinol methylase